MKAQFQVVAALLVLSFAGYGQMSQEPCGSQPTQAEYERYSREIEIAKQRGRMRVYSDNTIKVSMYRIRFSDGSGAKSDAEFAEEINIMNGFFEPYDICFSLMRIENIDSDQYSEAEGWFANYDSMRNLVKDQYPFFDDAVTIYVLPPHIDPSVKGKAFGIPSQAFSMVSSPGWWGTSLAAHEMGHCLGLLHTHENFDGFSRELVTRDWGASCINGEGLWQDCNVGGDKLCDTPADFGLEFNQTYFDSSSCTYNFDSVDCQGNTYAPDPANIMSYAPNACTNNFSGGQESKMHLTLDVDLIYNNKQASQTKELNGETISSGHKHELAKQIIQIANNSDYAVNESGQVVAQTEGHITISPGFIAQPENSEGYFVARVTDLCNNSTTKLYSYVNTNPNNLNFDEGINFEDGIFTGIDPNTDDFYGSSIAVDGDYLVIGAPRANHGGHIDNGIVYVYYHQNDSIWVLQDTLVASDGANDDHFGHDVDIDDRYIIVGAPGAEAAYIFWRGGSTWFQQDIITGSQVLSTSSFGSQVAITGDLASVSAPYENTSIGNYTGAVYVFKKNGLLWNEIQRLEPPNPSTPYSQFGHRLDMVNTRILVSQPFLASGGIAYIFEEDNFIYTVEGTLDGSQVASSANFGVSVALTDNEAYVGAPNHPFNGYPQAGVVYAFSRTGQNWSEETILGLYDLENFRNAGISIALNGDELAVGAAHRLDGNNQAYLFQRDYLGEWNQVFAFAPSTADASLYFGRNLGLNDDHLFISDTEYSAEGVEDEGGVYMYQKTEQ